MRLTIVVPVHNEASLIEPTARRLRDCPFLDAFSRTNIIFVENGSSDDSHEVLTRMEGRQVWPEGRGWLIGASVPSAGIGYAYAKGADLAIQRGMTSSEDWLLWTACDLPFGFSDMAGFLELRSRETDVSIVIGSKAHSDSVVPRSLTRKLMSAAFYGLRGAFLGMSTGDTQGTFFVRGDVLKPLVDSTQARDFFFTTEFCYHALKENRSIIEVPVCLEPELRPSTVRPLLDGWRMIQGLTRIARTATSLGKQCGKR